MIPASKARPSDLFKALLEGVAEFERALGGMALNLPVERDLYFTATKTGPAFLKGGGSAPWCCDTTPAG
jgi:hypothetical protein